MLIINAFDQLFIIKVQVSNDDATNVKIAQTYITDTFDLFMAFVVTEFSERYKLYMINLDESNLKEVDHNKNINYIEHI